MFFFFNDTATTEIYTLSLHDALPISAFGAQPHLCRGLQPGGQGLCHVGLGHPRRAAVRARRAAHAQGRRADTVLRRKKMKSNPCFASVATAAFVVLLACAPLAQAHNVWLEPDADGAYTVQFGGHEGKLENFAAGKHTSVEAYAARGRRIDVAVQPVPGGARATPARKAALLAAHFDNGFFSRVGEGPMVEKPMTENPGATSGVHALKFHKTILEWGPVTREKLDRKSVV